MIDFIKQVSVGYDALMKDICHFTKEIEPDYNSPYNILKKDDKYQVQFYIPGIAQEDVFVGFEHGILTIEAGKEDADETFLYRSVFNKVIKTKLMIARHLDVGNVVFTNGVLYIDFIDLLPARRDRVIMSGMVVAPPVEPVPVPVVDVPVNDPVVVEIVDAGNVETPTVEVIMPETIPQVVEIVNVIIEPVVDNASEAPQVSFELSDATGEVVADVPVETIVVETKPEEASNIVVVAPVEVVAAIEAAGVDIAHVVADAVDAAFVAETVTLPVDTAPVVETWTDEVKTEVPVETKEEFADVVVSVPDTISTVVEMVKTDENVFELVPVPMTEFKEESYEQIVPVVTAEGDPDILVAVSAEVKEEMAVKTDEELKDVLAVVVQEAEPMIVTSTDLDPLVMNTVETVEVIPEASPSVEDESKPSEPVTLESQG